MEVSVDSLGASSGSWNYNIYETTSTFNFEDPENPTQILRKIE